MAEFTNTTSQSVAVGANVLFPNTIGCTCGVTHRSGSGVFTLHGGKRYLVTFSGNISGATAGTEVDLSVMLNGESLAESVMAATPAVAGDANNVSTTNVITVPSCCCYTLSVANTGTTAVTVNPANLIIRRES